MTPDDNRPGARCAVLTTFFCLAARSRRSDICRQQACASNPNLRANMPFMCSDCVLSAPARPLVGGATRRDGFTSYLRLKDGRFEPSNPSVDVFQRIGIHR